MGVETFEWECGRGFVEPVGAMLGPVEFTVPGGRRVSPFAVAPWADDTGPEFETLPGLMKRLRGEWPCVPFGAPTTPKGMPEKWQGCAVSGTGSDFHGYAAHNRWTCVDREPGGLTVAIDYPREHAVARLNRRIRGVVGRPEIEIDLTVVARSNVSVPIALHPVFALPAQVGAAELIIPDMLWGHSFPTAVEPGISRITPDQEFQSLDRVPATGGAISLQRLPLPFATEELVQVFSPSGHAELVNQEAGYSAWIRYDPAVFPSIALWVSNRGRRGYPWNGRFTALGIEPLCGAFDLGPEVGANPENPFARKGIATSISLAAGDTFRTTYTIGICDLTTGGDEGQIGKTTDPHSRLRWPLKR